jgi:hypothetical protein
MGASHIGSSLGGWGSLLTINSRQPLRPRTRVNKGRKKVDGYVSVGMYHANCQQVSPRSFAALRIRSQRVAASAVHIRRRGAVPRARPLRRTRGG